MVSQVSHVVNEPLVCLYVKYIWFIFSEIFLRSRFEQTGNIEWKTLFSNKHACTYILTYQRTGVNFLFRGIRGFSKISGVLLGSWRGHGDRWYIVSSEISGLSLESFIHQNHFTQTRDETFPWVGWLIVVEPPVWEYFTHTELSPLWKGRK